MVKISKFIALVSMAALLSATTAMAQKETNQGELKKEITVKHQEEAKPTDAVKLNITPTVTMPPLPVSKLHYGMRQIRVGVPTSIPSLAPTAYADTIYHSPYRGYASAGYLPMMTLGASAGYKIIDNDRVRLNGWMQYNGTSYRGDMPWLLNQDGEHQSARLRRQFATVGAALHNAVGRESFLDFGLDYTFGRFNTPDEWGMRYQNVHRLNLSGLWSMTTGIWNTGIGAGFGLFSYGNPVELPIPELDTPEQTLLADSPFKPAREKRITAQVFASAKVWGADLAGIEANFSNLSYGNHAEIFLSSTHPYNIEAITARGACSHSLLSLRPFYRFNWKSLVLDLGANLDFAFNAGKVFHISPQAQATWKPSPFVAIYAKATGGVKQNTIGSLFDISYYGVPNLVYSNSNVPYEGEVGVTIGLWRGFYSELSASYAKAEDWLMPVIIDDRYQKFEPLDMKGYKLHVGLGYQYRNLLDASVSFEMAPQKRDHGYYMWRDRAKRVVEAKLKVTPIAPLDINLGWNYRGSRRTYGLGIYDPVASIYQPDLESMSLGTVNSLSIGGVYRLTPQLSIFAHVENLLNHRYTLIGGLPAQGIGGLAGVSYKF